MKKKILIFVLLVMVLTVLTACGKSDKTTSDGNTVNTGESDSQGEVYDDDVDWSTNSEFDPNLYMPEIDFSRSAQWNDAPRLSIQFYDIVVSSGMRLSTLLSRVANSKFQFFYDINPDRLINDYDNYTFYDGFNMEVFSVKIGKFGDVGVEPAKDCIIMEIIPYDYTCCRFFDGQLSFDDIMNYSYSDVPQLIDLIRENDPSVSIKDDGLNYSVRRYYGGNRGINPPESAYIYGKHPQNVADIKFSVDPDTAQISKFTYEAVISDEKYPIYRYDRRMHIDEAHLDEPWKDIRNFSDQLKFIYDRAYNQGEEYGKVEAFYIGIASDFTEVSTQCIFFENDVTFLFLVFDNKKGYSAEYYDDLTKCNVYNEVHDTYKTSRSIIGNNGRYYAESEEELLDNIFSKSGWDRLVARDSEDTLHGLKRIIRVTPDDLRNLVDFDFK